MKEQNKTPEKELNKMEISNLSGAEFKTHYQDAQGTHWLLQQHKKDISEIKKNVQGINSGMDEANNQIYDLEHKEGKEKHSIRTARRKKI